MQLVRQYIALLDTSVAVILAEEAEDEHVDILKKQSEVGEEVLCAPDSDPPPPIAGEGGEEVAALTLRQDEERDNGEGAATHAAAALEGKTSLPEDEDLPPSPTPEDEEQAEEMQEASRARASDILSTCFSTESDLSDSVLSAAIAEAKRSVGAAVSDEAHGGGDGRVGEGSGSSDPPMDDVKEPNARGGGTEGTGKAACPPAPLTTVTDEEGEGGEGRCLSQKPLTEHVVEDFLAAAQLPAALSPAALSSPGEGLAARNPATELPRLISRSPSGSPLSGSPRFPNRAERFSAKFSALFRLYKRVDDSEDLEDINFELEKDVMEKERRISLEADNRWVG